MFLKTVDHCFEGKQTDILVCRMRASGGFYEYIFLNPNCPSCIIWASRPVSLFARAFLMHVCVVCGAFARDIDDLRMRGVAHFAGERTQAAGCGQIEL